MFALKRRWRWFGFRLYANALVLFLITPLDIAAPMTAFSGKLTINLDAIAANWRLIQSRLAAGARAGAVVKADAYGLGVRDVAPALYRAGCRDFFVANLAEALLVRSLLAGDAQVIVLSGCAPREESEFVRNGIVPVITSATMAERWLGVKGASKCGAVLKVNSGMGRLGVEPNEFESLLMHPNFANAGFFMLMSHLACADQFDHPLNATQLQRFERMRHAFLKKVPAATASLANSSGIFISPSFHYDVARPGVALYGGNPLQGQQNPMQKVVDLRLPVLQVRHLASGEAVGYGASFITQRPSVLLTLAGGYADGLFRSAAPGGVVYLGEKPLPIVGRVSMDSIVVDATDVSQAAMPVEGDMLELLGDHAGVDDLAAAAGTIGYEILTSLGGRYRREYVGGAND